MTESWKDDFRQGVTDINAKVARPASADSVSELLKQTSTIGAIKRLGEMRLVALSGDGVMGLTRLGRDVALTLLFLVDQAQQLQGIHNPAMAHAALEFATTIPFEEIDDETRNDIEALMSDADKQGHA